MKKLIYLLLLISGGISAQIVQPRSTTTFSNVRATGSMTVANKLRVGSTVAPSATLDVTGTMSVSGTSTLTGAAKQTNTLNYEGNTTWNTNQTNTLTTGNTGTVAVLSDAVFSIDFGHTSSNPADATTYYFGNIHSFVLSGNSALGNIRLPYNCTLIGWDYNNTVTAGSSETATLSIAGSTNYTLSTSISFTASPNYVSGNSLSQNFNAGDIINAKLVCPTWVTTNPTALFSSLTLWFVRRQ